MADVKKPIDLRPITPVEHGAIVEAPDAPAGDTELLGNYFIVAVSAPQPCDSGANG
jgi:hypothetical protein